jgi:hypothetical protein
MAKDKVGVEDVTPVDEKKQEEIHEQNQTTDTREPMEEPRTVNYDQMYKISDPFINDLKSTVGGLAYSTANPFIRFVEAKKEGISIAELQELIDKLRSLPYRVVMPLMKSIENSDIVSKYFIALPNERK